MKKLLLIISLSLFTSFLSAQLPMGYFESISFDPPSPVYISINVTDTILQIDTSFVGNIWQIGKPQKTIFDSAYSYPNAIVTDTINNYPPNNLSAFNFKIFDPAWMSLTDPTSCVEFSFMHKFDTDSLKDGGYVEISYNNRITWTNIVNDSNGFGNPNFYYNSSSPPIITNGNAAFTGGSHGWQQVDMYGEGFDFFSYPYPVYLRFVFYSDSILTNKEGWMIDNLNVCMGCANCTIGFEEKQGKDLISIYPNPATNELTIDFVSTDKYYFNLFDLLGATILSARLDNSSKTVDLTTVDSGVYVYSIANSKGGIIKTDKLIIIK